LEDSAEEEAGRDRLEDRAEEAGRTSWEESAEEAEVAG
jgi:hypothetical protein